ncbi:MAG TPA: hypothetical protein VG938_09780 [Verrucomicrobiae bacterium]|nr:hypothetical protein [Verrucomicrobiae bacterium]
MHDEFFTDERIQIKTRRYDISASNPGVSVADAYVPANLVKNFQCEKSNLAPVIIFVVEKTIAFDAPAGHAVNLLLFNDRMPAGRLAVVAEKIMARRGIKTRDVNARGFEGD